MGPIDLDVLGDLPTIHQSKVKEYYGKRYILAGGRAPDNGSDDDDEEEDDDVAEDEKEATKSDPDPKAADGL
eukprot:4561320-Karenia_brevis.AAC.1